MGLDAVAMRLLLASRDLDIHCADADTGITVLRAACTRGMREVVQRLAEYGCTVDELILMREEEGGKEGRGNGESPGRTG